MSVEYRVLQKANVRSSDALRVVTSTAEQFLAFLRRATIQEQIAAAHQIGASSHKIQEVVIPGANQLGFTSEKKGLFSDSQVSALRPDYYLPVLDTGIILEVERGKTTTNNMDLLDFWKCHICEKAEYLFLLVPQERPSKNGTVLRHFRDVSRRLSTFFTPRNYVNVDAVFIFGY